MTETKIIETATNELIRKEFATTRQLLEIHQIVYENNRPKVLRVDSETKDNSAIVYFAIKDEKFYLAVWIDTLPKISIKAVGTENYHSMYLKIASETLTFEELSALTKLQPTRGWSKGDKRKFGNATYNFNALQFEPNPEPDEFEDKLNKLLDFLDKDRNGIKELLSKANGQIQVVSVFHNGNTMLGGHHLSKEIITRTGSYNLEVDFDFYAEGNKYKD